MKKNVLIYSKILCILLAFILVFLSGNTYSHAQAIIIDENVRESIYDILKENTKIQERSTICGYEDDPYDRVGAYYNNSNGYGYVLPDTFDPRNNVDYIVDDRLQSSTLLCWMYAPVNAAELLAAKSFGSKFELSKAYGAVCLSNSMKPTNYTGAGYYNRDADSKGYFSLALQYLTNWNTPLFNNETPMWDSVVAENDYPLSKITSNQYSPSDSDFINATPLLNVKSAVYLNNYMNCTGDIRTANMNNIKHAIHEYGGVSVPLRMSESYFGYDGSMYNYFISENRDNPIYNPIDGHGVVIVGWDDDYPKNRFNMSSIYPSHNGAWLVKNSLSRTCFWLSYDEASIAYNNNTFMAITEIQKASDKEHMLSYDYFPINKTEDYFNDDVYLCNIYDVSDLSDDYDCINKVMFYYCAEKSTDYKIKIVPISNNGSIPSNLDSYSILASGNVQGEGYITAQLNSNYQLSSSSKVAVIVIFSPQYTDSNCYIPFEGKYENTDAEINANESYFGFAAQNNTINWSDCTQTNQYDINANLMIRPIMLNEDSTLDNISISPTQIIDNNCDVNVSVSQMNRLFSVHTTANRILYEGTDYVRNSSGITIKESFIDSLNGAYTILCLDFTNDIQKTITVNPKSVITNISVSGDTIVGDLLSSSLTGSPPRDNYEVSYQWQYSVNGTNWSDISGATNSTYVIDNNLLGRYIRLKVSALNNYCNVEPNVEWYSAPTSLKVVVLGDVNLDGTVTVNDVTLLQKYLAAIVTLNNEQLLAADYNRDGMITIYDCTLIQMKASGLI